MDFGSLLGLLTVTVGAITVLGMGMETYRRRMAHRERMAELVAATPPVAAPETAKLEARLRVLERIATDKSGDLAHSIERLRDPSLVD